MFSPGNTNTSDLLKCLSLLSFNCPHTNCIAYEITVCVSFQFHHLFWRAIQQNY